MGADPTLFPQIACPSCLPLGAGLMRADIKAKSYTLAYTIMEIPEDATLRIKFSRQAIEGHLDEVQKELGKGLAEILRAAASLEFDLINVTFKAEIKEPSSDEPPSGKIFAIRNWVLDYIGENQKPVSWSEIACVVGNYDDAFLAGRAVEFLITHGQIKMSLDGLLSLPSKKKTGIY